MVSRGDSVCNFVANIFPLEYMAYIVTCLTHTILSFPAVWSLKIKRLFVYNVRLLIIVWSGNCFNSSGICRVVWNFEINVNSNREWRWACSFFAEIIAMFVSSPLFPAARQRKKILQRKQKKTELEVNTTSDWWR